ncbi:brca1 c terminus domain-containing protein [Ophiostoma piceae UAMH 11346]|uniref:Brca1 c terminus domain-containing protein n=1 Tax=Ophiostoma piceae (strain UAMH 11346) TaxID=1262450 RepID=S3C4J0_OPHP1|nr:brca1 c terminus domain-containing protein [Ophiostoma piceae UAMH 11346]
MYSVAGSLEKRGGTAANPWAFRFWQTCACLPGDLSSHYPRSLANVRTPYLLLTLYAVFSGSTSVTPLESYANSHRTADNDARRHCTHHAAPIPSPISHPPSPAHPPSATMLVSLTVGKVDAGVTVLLTQDKRLIEFPSILLPPNISSGSIVDIAVSRNRASEQAAKDSFVALQNRIYETFGVTPPTTPILRCRNATQTSVVLEWDPIQLATADLISLSLYRNGQKAGNIPRPLQMHSTKISGLAVDTEYTFHLVLRTSAGTFTSEKLEVRTHKMTDLSGVTITTGILPGAARERLVAAVERIGAKLVTEPGTVRIDTTHFVTTEGRGIAWEKAVELNIPVVRPEWVEACEKNGRILGVTKFYLDAVRPVGPNDHEPVAQPPQPQSQSQSQSQTQSQQDKELPQSPGSQDQTPVATATSTAKQSEDKASNAPAQAPEETLAASPGDEVEQKVFLGEQSGHEQKVALRTKNETAAAAAGSEDEEDAEEEDDEGDEEKAEPGGHANGNGLTKPAASGDGNSFQDVAL